LLPSLCESIREAATAPAAPTPTTSTTIAAAPAPNVIFLRRVMGLMRTLVAKRAVRGS
jgi:hypothetical protein